MYDLSAVRLRDVHKTFGSVHAVRGVSLSIRPGEILAFLGRNGAGKTSTIDIILGLSPPSAGEVKIFGMTPRRAITMGLVSAVMQSGGLLKDLTVKETVQYTSKLFADSRPVGEVLERAVTYVGLKIIGKLATILGGRAGRVLPTALPGPDSEGRPAQPHAELGRLLKADYPNMSFPRAFNLPAVFSGRGEQMGIGRSPLLASQCNLCRAGPARPTGHRSMASVTLRAPPA